MKKTIAKTAALIMAAMIAGTTCVPMTISAYKSSSTTSDESQVEMKKALTIVKKRIDIPKEASEFNYRTDEANGTRTFFFEWHTPNDAKQYRYILVTITGNIITEYYDDNNKSSYSDSPSFAELTENEIISKAKGYLKQLNPDIADSVKFEVDNLYLFDNTVNVNFNRYENGVLVNGNNGYVSINRNTGELDNMYVNWWGNAEFTDTTGAKSEKEIEDAYKKLCNLTPYYKIRTEYVYNEKTGKSEPVQKVSIVYEHDMYDEIDAFTGKKSTIWEDMNEAEGRHSIMYDDTEAGAGVEEEAVEEEVYFTPAELEKINQDENLIKTDEAFKMLKKDKFVALTDDYKLSSYNVYNEKNEKTDKETFYIDLRYTVKSELKKEYKGYKNVNVRINGETGEIISLQKYGRDTKNELPKLDVAKAHNTAKEAAKTYSKDIFSGYKAFSANTDPVNSWTIGKERKYETSRSFEFNRFVNGIQVSGDYISVDVDSNGVVTNYRTNHTYDVTFPSADILSESEAFDKLYEQKDFDYYYDGWVTKDGKVKTYLLRRMNSFCLNAKTGKLCNWDGSEKTDYIHPRDVKYSDIKGIKQEKAILELQKYGIVLTKDSKFKPAELISEQEFMSLMTNVMGGYEVAVEEEMEDEVPGTMTAAQKKEKEKKLEAEKKDKAETTMREAAVMFGKLYLPENIAKMNIFKSPFSDVKDTDEDAGYLAVAYEKDFVKGTDGKLGGNNTITRAEAVQIMYDYVKALSK
mgnify:CR=1 FL=1